MGNVDKFMDRLKAFKQLIDDGGVPKKNVDACRPYLELEHFTREIIYNKSRAAAGQGLTLVHFSAQPEPFIVIEPAHRPRASHETCLR
jgi:dynein heavy chain